MSRRGELIRARRRYHTGLETREPIPDRFIARMGNGEGVVEVPGKGPTTVYVRGWGRTAAAGRGIVEVLNTRVPNRNNLHVVVGYDPVRPDTLQVLEVFEGGMSSGLGAYRYVPHHHEAHEFRNIIGGDDVVWIQSQQFVRLLAYPTSPESMRLNVYEGFYPWLTTSRWFPGGVANLAGHVPAGPGMARYTLVSIDGATNTLQYTDGPVFPWLMPPVDPSLMFAVTPAGCVPIVQVALINGTTSLGWDELFDVREFFSPSGGSVTPAPHYHTSMADGGAPLAGTSIELEEIPVASFDDLQDYINTTQSAGRLSELDGLMTPNAAANGTLDVSNGRGFIKVVASETGLTKFFNWDAVAGMALVDQDANYVFVDYNVATEAVTIQSTIDRTTIDGLTEFILGRVWRDGNDLHIAQSGTDLFNHDYWHHQRLVEVRGFERARGGNITAGTIGADSRYLISDAGRFYHGGNLIITAGRNTTAADRFTAWYNDGAWQDVINQQVVDNTQYNDYGVGLAPLTAALPFGVHWVFVHYDGDLQVVYGTSKLKLADAEAATVPSNLPEAVSEFATLAAKIIIERNGLVFTAIVSGYDRVFPVSQAVAVDHEHTASGDGGAYIRPVRLGVGTAVADQDGVITLPETADPTNAANEGRIYVKDDGSGNTELYYMDEAGNVAKLTPVGAVPAPTAEGQALVSNAVPAWIADTTPLWLGVHTHADNVIYDDGVGDSPRLQFIGGGNDDTIEMYLEDGVMAGDSLLIIKLCDAAGDSGVVIRDSNDATVLTVDSHGNVVLIDNAAVGISGGGRFVFDSTPAPDQIIVTAADLDLQGNKFIIDNTDDDTYLVSPADDQIDLYIAGALDFSWMANAFTVLAGSDIVMGDASSIGIGPALERLVFDDAGNLQVLGADLGIGRLPTATLDVYEAVAGTVIKAESAGSNQVQLGLVSSHNSINNSSMQFFLQNNTPASILYAGLSVANIVRGAGIETGRIGFTVRVAGAWANRMELSAGLKINNLAGVGVRNVVADALGNLSAP